MWDESVGRHFLKEGDAFAKRGDVALAVEQYLLYCEHLEHLGEFTPEDPSGRNLRLVAVRMRILRMRPGRRDVRRELVENLVSLGLADDARKELRRLVSEWGSLGDEGSRAEALARLRELG